jgi:drug/metabolite transporter (DMT)-like permease
MPLIASVWLKEKASWLLWISVVIGFLGVMFILWSFIGIGLVVIGGIFSLILERPVTKSPLSKKQILSSNKIMVVK